jgi:pimeloyl-ACP methyl ester carboxylesterase
MRMKPDWLDQNEYPFESQYLNVEGGRLHYIDAGQGEVLLFVHGTPSWSFEYRNIIKGLSGRYRCIALDHIGFGLSDKPDDYDYSPGKHSENLGLLIHHLKLTNITLVVHDFGGPIGLSYAIQNPGLIKQLVVFNTWLWSFEDEPQFKKLKGILSSPLLPFLYRYFNFSARVLLPQSFANRESVSAKIKRHYTKPFGKPSERSGTIGFAKSLINDQVWFESLWETSEVIRHKRTLFIWGMADKFIQPRFLEKFESGFPNSKSIRVGNAGHFPQEENSSLVISEIQKWLTED